MEAVKISVPCLRAHQSRPVEIKSTTVRMFSTHQVMAAPHSVNDVSSSEGLVFSMLTIQTDLGLEQTTRGHLIPYLICLKIVHNLYQLKNKNALLFITVFSF